MSLVLFLQGLSSSFLTFICALFDFLGQNYFFVFCFALFYLVVNKDFAYKFFVSYVFGFSISNLALKNIFRRPRPYVVNDSILSERSSFGFSLPSFSTTISATTSYFVLNKICSKKEINKIAFISTFTLLFFVNFFVGFSQIYFGENFLLDVILGFVIGGVIAYIVCKFFKVTVKTKKIFAISVLPVCFLIFVFLFRDIISNNFSNMMVFEFLGVCVSLIVGSYLEEKFIKYTLKNNLILILLKVLILIIVFISYHYLFLLIAGHVIFAFIKYLVLGFIVTLVLPLLFNYLNKVCYIFSTKVDEKNVLLSAITLSENQTKRVAKKISKHIKKGDCVLMCGDLGSGKSVVVREILKVFGVNKKITSPTFTLVNEYYSNGQRFYHFDMYRLNDEEEVVNIGFEEILDNKKAIKFIEWPERVESFLPKHSYKKITIVKLGSKSRNIILEQIGE